MGLVSDPHEADDVTQEAALTALLHPPPAGAAVRPWLATVLRRVAWRRRRSERRRADHELLSGLPQEAPGEVDALERIDVQRVLLEAVRGLEEPLRTTIVLRYFEGRTSAEIARASGVPAGTVRARLKRALDRLRGELDHDNGSRRTWIALVAHFLPREAKPVAGGAVVASAHTRGILTMSLVKPALSGALVVLAAFVAWRATRSDAESDLARTEPAGPTVRAEPANPGFDPAPNSSARTVLPSTSPAASAAATLLATGRLDVAVSWADGSPAAGVAVIVQPEGGAAKATLRDRRTTDAAGRVSFQTLAPMTWTVLTDRGDAGEERRVEVSAGKETAIALRLRAGVTVVGRVMDDAGGPVASAGIWLTAHTDGWTAGGVVTKSDGAGRFLLRDVPRDQSLGAVAPAYAPSALVDLDSCDTSRDPVEIELLLSGRGGGLFGTVTDEAGEPVRDAIVAVGDGRRFRSTNSDGTVAEGWTTRAVRSDDAGRYVVSGLDPGRTVVRTKAPAFAAWTGEADVIAGGETRCDVRLQRGGAITGRVRDAHGEPVAGATVHAFPEPLNETFLQSGQIDAPGPFAHLAADVDSEGAYSLEHVAPGTAHVYAIGPREARRSKQVVVPYARTTLEVEPGGVCEWNARLGEGNVIDGCVYYANGTPMGGVYLSAENSETGARRVAYTEDGRFRFAQVEDVPHNVRVQLGGAPEGTRPLQALLVRPNGDPLRLVASFGPQVEHEPASVLVRFADRGARATGEGQVVLLLELLGDDSYVRGELEGDAWMFDVERPGTYVPLALLGERLIGSGPPAEIDAGGTYDLGTIVSRPGADLVLTIQRDDATRDARLALLLFATASRRVERIELGARSELECRGLEPGAMKVRLVGSGVTQLEREIELVAGAEAQLDLTLVPAVSVRYEVRWDDEHRPETLTVRVTRASDGEVPYELIWDDFATYPPPFITSFPCPVGTFVFEALAEDGRSGRVPFVVESLGAGPSLPLRVDLR